MAESTARKNFLSRAVESRQSPAQVALFRPLLCEGQCSLISRSGACEITRTAKEIGAGGVIEVVTLNGFVAGQLIKQLQALLWCVSHGHCHSVVQGDDRGGLTLIESLI